MKPQIDFEFQKLIPPLSVAERGQLKANIDAEGCRDALILWNGKLLDGHNRLEICEEIGKPYKTVEIDLPDRNAAKLWIIDNQAGRRNLADIDRIALARHREEIVAKMAKGNQRQSAGRGKKGSAKLPNLKPVDTRKASAKAAGVGERTYDAGKLILDAAAAGEIVPEVVEQIRRGEAAIHRVAKEIKETRQRSGRQSKRNEAAKDAPLDSHILVGDFRDLEDKIPDGSISLIFTDPPYNRKAAEIFPELGDFAARKLAEGGSLICYVGHIQLRQAINDLSDHLRHWWTIACVHSGGSTVMREYGINACWKPVLWFVKGTRDNKADMVNDVMSGGKEKDHHDWQQASAEAQYWIEHLCPKNGIVLDPFLGSGTTAAAAEVLGRKWIGIEIDKDAAAIASKRLSQ